MVKSDNLLTFAPRSLTIVPTTRSATVPSYRPHLGSRRYYSLLPPSRRNPSWRLTYSYERPSKSPVYFIYLPCSTDFRRYARTPHIRNSTPISDLMLGSLIPAGFPLFAEAMSDYV